MDINMKIKLPEAVSFIINKLEQNNFEAYAVGGCVRDSILERDMNDWDITTSATPAEVKQLFSHCIDTGIEHGTVTILIGKEGFEVTTFRIDGEYEDARHPKEVAFTSSLAEDLRRRDFTMNALAYSEKTGIVDLFHGIEDMEQKVIRAVGNPRERFMEDALRIMRGVRFAAQLDAEIEEETKQAIKELAVNLEQISAERIQIELVKLVTSDHPEKMKMLYDLSITKVIMNEFDSVMETKQNNPHHCYSVGEHIVHGMMNIKNDKCLRLAMLFHDFGKAVVKTTDDEGIDHFHGHAVISEKMSKQILRRLKFDCDTIHKVSKLVLYHDYNIEGNKKSVRRAVNKIGEDLIEDLFLIKRADITAQSQFKREEKLQHLQEVENLYQEIKEAGECLSLKQLAITGSDLISHGIKPGKEIGEMLNQMLQHVLVFPEDNTKEKLMKMLFDR